MEHKHLQKFIGIPTREATVQDNRGGHRPDAGRKSKDSCLWSTRTAPIRVPEDYKHSIKGFIDWLIEKASEGESISGLLVAVRNNTESLARGLSCNGLDDYAKEELKHVALLDEMLEKLPSFTIREDMQERVDAANRQIIDLVNGEAEDPRQMHIDFGE